MLASDFDLVTGLVGKGARWGTLIWLLSGRTLDQLMLVMNDKQNRWAAQVVYNQVSRTWLADVARRGTVHNPEKQALDQLLAERPGRPRRLLVYVRAAQQWDSFFQHIPKWRLVELALEAGKNTTSLPSGKDCEAVVAFVEGCGRDLSRAKQCYASAGREHGASDVNEVDTNFTGLPTETVNTGRRARRLASPCG